MNCHNAEQYLSEAIECVLSQTYNNWELIIWNNKSNDGTQEIAESYNDPRIKIFQSKNFTTLGKARNLAIAQSRGEFIAFLDSDDIWFPEKLLTMMPRFTDQKVGICISNTIFFNKKSKKILYLRKKPPVGRVFRRLLQNNFISLETVILRKKAITNISFNDAYNMIEEYDFFLRVAKNWELDYVDIVLSGWRIHETSITQKRPKLLAVELEKMLKDLASWEENFEEKYKAEINIIYQKILILKVLYAKSKYSLAELVNLCQNANIKIHIGVLVFALNFTPYSIKVFLVKARRSL